MHSHRFAFDAKEQATSATDTQELGGRSFNDRLGLSDFVHGIKAGPSILNDIKGQCLHLILDRIWETVRDINTGIEVCKP